MNLIGFTIESDDCSIQEVTPIFSKDNDLYMPIDSSNILMSFITSIDDQNKIDKEIEAYLKKEHSYISSVIDYSKRDLYTFKTISPKDNFKSIKDFENLIIEPDYNPEVAVSIGINTIVAGSKNFVFEKCNNVLIYRSDLTNTEIISIINILKSLRRPDECMEFISAARNDNRFISIYVPYQQPKDYFKCQTSYCKKMKRISN